MKKSEKLRALGAIDEKYIEEAEKEIRFGANKNLWIRVGAIAACFVFILGAAIVPFLTGGAEEIGREIKNEADCSKTWEDIGTMEQDSGMPWVWNKEEGIFERSVIQVAKYDNVPEIAPSNQGVDTVIVGGSPAAKRMIWYPIFMDDYQNYSWADRSVRAEHLGAQIGTVPLTLIDVADGKGITDEALIHEIEGIHHYYAIAVRPEQQYLENSNLTGNMIFYRRDVQFDTFAEMIDAYALDEQMYVGSGFVKATKTEDGWVETVTYHSANIRFVNNILATEGVSVEIPDIPDDCESVGFDCHFRIAGGDFGMQIFENGYLLTNIGGTLHAFDIGTERAAYLIRAARAIPDNIGTDIRIYDDGMRGSDDIREEQTLPYDPGERDKGNSIPE